MGMRAHLVAVEQNAAELDLLSDDEVSGLLTGPNAAQIDKSWEAVFPLIGAIAGTGMMLVDDPLPVGGDLGFGPALFIDPSQAAAIASRLEAADDATIEAHWSTLDSPFMADFYDDAEGKDFALWGYREASRVFATAAAESKGVLFAIM